MYSTSYQQPIVSSSFQPEGPVFNVRMFKTYGAILSILAAATLAIGVANVVLTSQAYCDPWSDMDPVHCSNTNEPYVWTWVASGIWASMPIFAAGLFAMCLSSDPSRWIRLFALLIFLSAIVFAPAMIILSSIEVWRGGASKWHFYKLGDQLMEGNIMVEESPFQAKFALPLVITILAGIMFIMTGLITLVLCCCMQSMGISLPTEPSVQQIYTPTPAVIETKEIYVPPRPQMRTQIDYQPTTGPYMATRYNSVVNPNNPGAMFGNFPSRAFTASAPVNNYFDANPNYRFN